ncbi:MAG: hypothetical protein QME61_00665 [Patescibacteria group bacterium]|nr:hypothetical protein [Patescibacteria group bacterium]
MIEIIPKPAPKIISWLNILFYFSIALLIAVILSFFALNHFVKKLKAEFQDLEAVLIKQRTPAIINLEKEILSSQRKIEDMDFLLKRHLATSKVLEFLEKVTHPKVWFFSLDWNSEERRLRVSGITENFQILGQQLLIFQDNQFIKEVNLSKISIDREGKISFNFDLLLDPQIFEK